MNNSSSKITKAYNLPSKYIIHTVGPQVENRVTKQNEIDLANCYYSCLKLADSLDLKSLFFVRFQLAYMDILLLKLLQLQLIQSEITYIRLILK